MTKPVLTGRHFFYGNHACAEGALAAGCTFFGGYPITPSSEIAERMARRLPEIGGIFLQMEDEIASITAILGASATGAKVMTATSGPGLSLMLEGIGLGIMEELPCVIVNVQRGGPSTGLPTLVGQQDMMQARWGSHGDYAIIAYSPFSPQECFDLMITAFNAAEKYRTPVIFLSDEVIGHMHERVDIPDEAEIESRLISRPMFNGNGAEYLPFLPNENLVPEFAPPGAGHAIRMTGLTHDDAGKTEVNSQRQEILVPRLKEKIERDVEDITLFEEFHLDDAETVVITYGITARCAKGVIGDLRKENIKIGMLRLISIWPFPDYLIKDLMTRVKNIIVPEINLGQMVREIQRCATDDVKITPINYAGGSLPGYEDLYTKIKEKCNDH